MATKTKQKIEIKEIDKQTCVELLQKYHYHPIMPKITKHYLGGYINNNLIGCLTLGWGTQPKGTIKKLFTELDTKDYYEIGKMALLDEMPRNTETQFLSAIVKWIKKNLPELKYLYTLADGIQGKCGYVYQAANFYYGGSYKTITYRSHTGEKIHKRTTQGALCKENAEFLGVERITTLTQDFLDYKQIELIQGLMFRYILPLNKKHKKNLKNSNIDWNKDYPKDKDLLFRKRIKVGKYITIQEPYFKKTNFEYNYQKIRNDKQLKLL
tara:strand:+ start:76 stop:879 length:804 start_codon:yes stop_codon:yes gene_type:complete